MSAPKTFALDLKSPVYDALAALGRAVSSPRRLELLEHLAQGPRAVEALASLCEQSVANTSAHLKVLKQTGLVLSSRQGKQVVYRVRDRSVVRFLVELRGLGEALQPEVRQSDAELSAMVGAPRSLAEVRREVQEDRVTLIDVRTEGEYEAGHLPGAHHVPADELGEYVEGFRRSRPIVVYGRGHGCARAVRVVRALRRHGYEAELARGGVADWVARGYALGGEEQVTSSAPANW